MARIMASNRRSCNRGSRAPESGNVFLIILIGIAMFAALMFTFSRGIQQGTEGMNGREAELAASDIVSYGQQVQRGVERVISRGVSETDISFANPTDTNYTNPNCSGDNRCLVFHPEGGAVTWKTPPQGVNYTSAAYFIGPNRVGSADGVTINIGTSERDLVIMLPVSEHICAAINGLTSKLDTWTNGGTANVATRFIGNYTAGGTSAISYSSTSHQPTSGCFCDGVLPCTPPSKQLYYYNTLHVR